MNVFYARFSSSDFSEDILELKQKLRDTQHFIIELSDVQKAFHAVNVIKSLIILVQHVTSVGRSCHGSCP